MIAPDCGSTGAALTSRFHQLEGGNTGRPVNGSLTTGGAAACTTAAVARMNSQERAIGRSGTSTDVSRPVPRAADGKRPVYGEVTRKRPRRRIPRRRETVIG